MSIISNFPTASGGSSFNPEVDIIYTGDYTSEEMTMDGQDYVLMTFTSSGNLTVNKEDVICDVCVCGGGAGGQATWRYSHGGHGGFITNQMSTLLESGDITIGAGGGQASAGGASSYGSITAAGGTTTYDWTSTNKKGGSGGGGGGFGGSSYQMTGQGTTTRPFGSADMQPMGAGGGGGGIWDDQLDQEGSGGSGGSDGGNGSGSGGGGYTGGAGGNYGGGSGGSASYGSSTSGTDGTYYGAGGGGGGCFVWYDGDTRQAAGGKGYQGVVMIRVAI